MSELNDEIKLIEPKEIKATIPTTTKICTKCKKRMITGENFDKSGNHSVAGMPLYVSKCRECNKEHIKRDIMRESGIKASYPLKSIKFDEIFKKDEPIVTSMISSSKGGKTTLLYNLIDSIAKFNDVVLFFTTNSKAKIYRHFDNKKLIIIQDFDPRIIYALHHLNQQCNNKFKFFVLLDDIIDVKYSAVISQLYSTYRNAGFSCLHSIQYMKYMNCNSRAQCHAIFFGRMNSVHEVRKIVEEYFYGFTKLMESIPEKYKSKTDKLDYLCMYYMKNTENYNFIVLDVLNDELYKIRSEVIIK